MRGQLKPIEDQVIVIAGASSGIGLTTARMAADRGATVVVAARSEEDLDELEAELEERGAEAVSVVADVRDRDDVRKIREVAEEEFGGFDTWVNVAGAFVYGKLQDVPIEDMREVFETNVWGLLYGSLEATDHFKERGGGAIINIGSVTSDRSFVLQGSYSASKHAVKAFTDALRVELSEENAPISVTLIKPSAIDTPYPEHAKNYMDRESTLPPPIYAPETVAREILDAAERPRREVTVGFGGKAMSVLHTVAPGVMDTLMEKVFTRLQKRDTPPRSDKDTTIDGAAGGLEERGDTDRHTAESSLYNKVAKHGKLVGAALVGAGIAAALFSRERRRSPAGSPREETERPKPTEKARQELRRWNERIRAERDGDALEGDAGEGDARKGDRREEVSILR